jgi:hypothetical protein
VVVSDRRIEDLVPVEHTDFETAIRRALGEDVPGSEAAVDAAESTGGTASGADDGLATDDESRDGVDDGERAADRDRSDDDGSDAGSTAEEQTGPAQVE